MLTKTLKYKNSIVSGVLIIIKKKKKLAEKKYFISIFLIDY